MGNFKFYNGELVKSNDPAVYFVINERPHHIENPSSFNALFKQSAWKNIKVLPQNIIDSMEKGEVIGTDGSLSVHDSKVYLIPNRRTNKRRHWIINPGVFNCCKFIWEKIKNENLSNFEDGDNILFGGLNLSDWMMCVKGHTSIADISIPGTHDASMWSSNMECKAINFKIGGSGMPLPMIKPMAECQKLSFVEQFDAGVRFFDMRVCWLSYRNATGLVHVTNIADSYSGGYSKILFREAVDMFINKLVNHPSEFIILSVAVEADIKNRALVNKRIVDKYKAEVDAILKEYKDYVYVDKGEANMDRSQRNMLPVLDDIRGKIFIISDASTAKGHLADGFRYDPWRFRYKPNGERLEYHPGDAGYFDCTSTNKTFTESNTPRKAVESLGDNRRLNEFHSMAAARNEKKDINECRLGRFGVNQPYAFKGKYPKEWADLNNPLILKYLKEHKEYKRMGVVGFDFIDAELALELIKVNPDIQEYYSYMS